MIIRKLKLKNIRSYEDLEISFPEGSTLLAGDIGSGKTSILLALQFALFGLQPGQKGASILRQGETKANVYLEIEVDTNKIILERTIKKSKAGSISQESNFLTINNERKELSTSEMKNRVIQLLDYPKEFVKKSNLLYKFTVYTPQEEMKAIIQERPEIRLDTLRHIFGIDRYKRIKENSQIFLQTLKEKIKIKEVEIQEINLLKERLTKETEDKIKLSKEINNLNIEFTNLKQQKQKEEQELNIFQDKIKQKQKLDSELTTTETELQGKKALKDRLEKEIISMQKQTQQKIDFSEPRLKDVSALLLKHQNLLDELNSKFLEINAKISVFNSKKEDAQNLKEKISNLQNCPTCFQQVSTEHKEKISKRTQYDLEDMNRELELKLSQKQQTINDIEKEKKLIKGYEQDKSELEKNKIKFEHQKNIETKIKSDSFVLDRTLKEINELDKKISELKISIEQFSQTEKIYEQQKSKFEELNINFRELEIKLAEKNKEFEILKVNLEKLIQDVAKKEKTREQLNHLRQLQDWMQEKFLSIITLTEKNVLAKLRSEFSKIFSEWFSVLVPESLTVRLDEDFTPIIQNQDYEIDYDFLSGGERTAVALAYRLALNQVLNSLLSKIKTKDVIILDEPTDGFSAEQLDKIRDIFDQLEAEQVILVSHEQKIEGFVDNIIRIKKEATSKIDQNPNP